MSTVTNTQRSIERLAREPFVRAVKLDENNEITNTINGTIVGDVFCEIGKTGHGIQIDKYLNHGYIIEEHPAASWLTASAYSIERDVRSMEIYATESGLANISRTIGYCAGLIASQNDQLAEYGCWVLIGLHRNLDYLGCWRNRLQYDENGQDLQLKYPYEFDSTEEEQSERYAKIEEETVARVPSSKKLLFSDNEYSFSWVMYHAVPHKVWNDHFEHEAEQTGDSRRDITERLNEGFKILTDEDAAHLLHNRKFTETHYHYYFTTRYRRGMNGGLIQRFLQDDLDKMKADCAYHSYSIHS